MKAFHKVLLGIGAIFSVLAIAYVYVRHMLNPVKKLIIGVNEVAKGNFDVIIPVSSHDEFGMLTESFNRMIESIRRMISQKKQLLYDVSHELRSPLTRIKIALEMLPESASRQDIAGDIIEMETMIDELLEAARLEQSGTALQLERIEMGPFLLRFLRNLTIVGQVYRFMPGNTNCTLTEIVGFCEKPFVI
jgi:two-component system sensor histidine kinase CpxA